MSGPAVALDRVVERLADAGLLVSAPGGSVRLTGVTDDSRRVTAGDLFCAWAGTEVDAHRFVAAAEAGGAVAALVERPVQESALPQVVVRDGRLAAGLAAQLIFGDPGKSLLLVGVTGTNGKTTTVWLLRHLLGGRYSVASLGTLGVVVGDDAPSVDGETLTTPGPVDVARTLRRLHEDGVRAVALEVSSHALDQGRVHALRFTAAVFTNLSRDHLDYHGSADAYRDAKHALTGLLRPDGTAVVNADEPAWADLPLGGRRRLRYGLHAPDIDVRAERLRFDTMGARFDLVAPGATMPASLPLPGDFNVMNALGAAAACLALGFSPEEVADRLGSAPQVPGRLERIADEPCPVLRDYAHTPDALERALGALRAQVPGRLIVVFGAGGDRDRGKRPLMGAVAERCAHVVVVTSDNPRTEDPEAIIDDIVAGMEAAPDVREADRRVAIGRALDLARADDLVLLAGKGHETYQTVGTSKRPFDEREVVATLWAERAREASG